MAKAHGANVPSRLKTLKDILDQPGAREAWVRLSRALPSGRLGEVERLLVRIANRDFFEPLHKWVSLIPTPRDARRMADRLDRLRYSCPPTRRRNCALKRLASKLERVLFWFGLLVAFSDVLAVLNGAPAAGDLRRRLSGLSRALRVQSQERRRLQWIPPDVRMEQAILQQLCIPENAGAARASLNNSRIP